MKRMALVLGVAVMAFAPAAAMAQPFSDDFDSYTNGQNLHGVGGWLGWDGDAGSTGFVTNAQSDSAPHSLAIDGRGPGNVVSDLVQEFSTDGTGTYNLSVDTYCPSGSTGQPLFIMLNRYNVGGSKNWSTAACFDHPTGMVLEIDFGIRDRSGRIPIVYDAWAPIEMVINLDAGTVSFSYNGEVLYADQNWVQTGDRDIGAVDLWSNNASVMYYDNFVMTREPDCDPCDMDCDGDINAFDIEPFLGLLFDPNAKPCDTCTGDADRNGTVDAFDIEPFLECLFGP